MLKWVALVLMLVDHFAYTLSQFLPNEVYLAMRILGRLSFPIFVYYVMLGLGRTSNLSKYMWRLLAFGILSEIVKRLSGFNSDPYLNVIFSLLLYGIFFVLLEGRLGKLKLDKITRFAIIGVLLFLLPYVEYGYAGLLVFLSLYYINKEIPKGPQNIYAAMMIALSFLPGVLFFNGQHYQLLAAAIGLFMFNPRYDRRILPPAVEKWTFYWVYPLQWAFFGALLYYMWN